jgi:hypothetical protein
MSKLQISVKLSAISFFLLLTGPALAAPVSMDNAAKAARGWLRTNTAPLETAISKKASQTEAVSAADGRVLYYMTSLEGQGFVILAGDDELEPVVAFSATGYFDDKAASPLRDMLVQDMQGRLAAIGGVKSKSVSLAGDMPGKWQDLIAAGTADVTKGGVSSPSDVRISPLVQSKWSQDDAGGGYCYNYYTPNHYSTGCVATAMAQLMRYHSWPTAGIGVNSFEIKVDNISQYGDTRGGDGFGGPYNWSDMTLVPGSGLTTAQRQAIGSLCYDAGLSVSMGYTEYGSGASTSSASEALVDTFGYSNSVYGYGFSSGGDAGLLGMINTNLDARLPVVLSIAGPNVAHALIADGYGYNSGTMYHHLNMGWGGLDDTWYALPIIESGYYFNAVTGCMYNVYPDGSGEIISGRVVSMAGAALEGVTVRAYNGSVLLGQADTDSRGIYALKDMPANTVCRVVAAKNDYAFLDKNITTGHSQNWNAVSGNKWGIDFAATNPSAPMAISQNVSVYCLSSASITLESQDDHLPNPPAAVTSIISSLPAHGTLRVPGVGEITSVPYSLPGYGNEVVYQPCQYYFGPDSFSFVADDGGSAPTGGTSAPAIVSLDVSGSISAEFGLDGQWGNNAAIDTGFYALRSQALYLASDIGNQSGYFTSLAFDFTGIPPLTLHNWTIRMQLTGMSQYNDVVASLLTTGWTQVYQTDLTVSETGWFEFHFDTPFYYDGSSNLLIDFSFDNSEINGNTGWYLCKAVGCGCDRIITIKSNNPEHTSPLTWDFWGGGGIYWGGDWLPSIKLTGNVANEPIAGDFDYNCKVNLPDMATLAAAWNSQSGDINYNPACDIARPVDNVINMLDLQVFVENWLP